MHTSKLQKGFIHIFLLIVLVFIGFGVLLVANKNIREKVFQQFSKSVNQKESPIQERNKEVAIVDGDVSVLQSDGTFKKITSWRYNSRPLMSPDETKIAYSSDTPETLAREEERNTQGYGFVEGSQNIFIINTDGTKNVVVTKHMPLIYREPIKWVDNDRLLFLDGEKTVRMYMLSTKEIKVVLGSELPRGSCVDSCYGIYDYHTISPQGTYFVNFHKANFDNIIEVLNLETLATFEIKNDFYQCMSNVTFATNDVLTFTGIKESDIDCTPKEKGHVFVVIDLSKKTVKVEELNVSE